MPPDLADSPPGIAPGTLEAPAAGTVTAEERSATLTTAEGCGEPWPLVQAKLFREHPECGARDMARKELVVTQDSPQAMASVGSVPGFDPSVANAARMWNYWIGGKDNFSADREAAEKVLKAMPVLPLIARMLRRFLINTVDELAAAGVRQFLDIGTGLPTADNTHDVAQRAAPESRIVYVDHDPVVISHAHALLTSSPAGKTDFIQADLRDWSTISAGARQALDFSRPVAVLLIAVLHFILDAEDPHRIVARMMADLAPGSYLVIAHAASDIEPATAAAMARSYNASSSLTITPRDRAQVARFFDGLQMTGPGLLPLARWSGSSRDTVAGSGLSCYCGIARKP